MVHFRYHYLLSVYVKGWGSSQVQLFKFLKFINDNARHTTPDRHCLIFRRVFTLGKEIVNKDIVKFAIFSVE